MDKLVEISALDNLLCGMCHVSSFTYIALVLIYVPHAHTHTHTHMHTHMHTHTHIHTHTHNTHTPHTHAHTHTHTHTHTQHTHTPHTHAHTHVTPHMHTCTHAHTLVDEPNAAEQHLLWIIIIWHSMVKSPNSCCSARGVGTTASWWPRIVQRQDM